MPDSFSVSNNHPAPGLTTHPLQNSPRLTKLLGEDFAKPIDLSQKDLTRLVAQLDKMSVPERKLLLERLENSARKGDTNALLVQIDILRSGNLSRAAADACKEIVREQLERLGEDPVEEILSPFLLHLATSGPGSESLMQEVTEYLNLEMKIAQNRMNNLAENLQNGINEGRPRQWQETVRNDLATVTTQLGDIKELMGSLGQSASIATRKCLRARHDGIMSEMKGTQPRGKMESSSDGGKRINITSGENLPQQPEKVVATRVRTNPLEQFLSEAWKAFLSFFGLSGTSSR